MLEIIQFHILLLLIFPFTFAETSHPVSGITTTRDSSKTTPSALVFYSYNSNDPTTTSIPLPSDRYTDLATSALPVFKFFQGNGLLFDYPVEIGQSAQLVGLRLDVVQGDVWIPATDAFTECSKTGTSSAVVTTLSDYSEFVIPTSTSTSTSNNPSVTIDMVDPIFSQSCASLGVFDIFNSITSNFLNLYENLKVGLNDATSYIKTYISGILVSGVWVVDDFVMSYTYDQKIESIQLTDVPFVYSNFSNVGVGALAIGASQTNYTYTKNFISNFVINKIIKTNSYSLALSDLNGTSPKLILGGIATNYIGNAYDGDYNLAAEMALFDFLPVYDESETIVNLNNGLTDSIPAFPIFGWGVTSNATGQSITFSNSYDDKTSISTYPKPAIFDSRYYYNFIPYSTLVEMAIELNAVYSSDLDKWLVDCSVGTSGTINLLLGNYTIHIPISKFLYPASSNNTELVFKNGDSACYLAFLPDYKIGFTLMGTPLLKNIYLAVDNENKQLAISELQDQLKDSDIVVQNNIADDQISVHESAEINNVNDSTITTITTSIENLNKRAVTALSQITPSTITHGVSTLSNSDYRVTIKLSSEVTVSSSIYETTILYSDDQRISGYTESNNLFAIQSGVIPFAKKYTTVSNLTLTIPKSVVFTDTVVQSTGVVISNGEIYLQTTDGVRTIGGSAGGAGVGILTPSVTTETSSIYGFTSLVSLIKTNKVSGSGNNLKVPRIFHLQLIPDFKSLGNIQFLIYILMIVIGIAIIL
jgi:hypothetical protein